MDKKDEVVSIIITQFYIIYVYPTYFTVISTISQKHIKSQYFNSNKTQLKYASFDLYKGKLIFL